jgi:hypothetical protein
VVVNVDPTSGLLAREGQEGESEEFLEGTAPEALAPEEAPEAGEPTDPEEPVLDDEALASREGAPVGSLPEAPDPPDAGPEDSEDSEPPGEPPPPPF